MENVKRPLAMGSCKKHPKHQQSSGVCSLCLRERLSNISSSSSSQADSKVSSSSSSSSISYVSSVSSSLCSSNVASYLASPMHDDCLNSRRPCDVEGKGYFSFLRKSRSMAIISEKIVENDGKKKKGDGFWSKLIGFKRSSLSKGSIGKGSSRLMHSRTMKEMLTTRV
uniref:uncharacterized protein LOC122589691 n=1 Tax=Erigeron canadensis TaxID=72917 RepID=UPI001CB8AFD4|nr:uncharacterized protein LOC122589691 [Erigeron canadensis]